MRKTTILGATLALAMAAAGHDAAATVRARMSC